MFDPTAPDGGDGRGRITAAQLNIAAENTEVLGAFRCEGMCSYSIWLKRAVALSAVGLTQNRRANGPGTSSSLGPSCAMNCRFTKERAFQLILDSISAAQACAEAVNRRSGNIIEAKSRAKMCLVFKRLDKCCRRVSAGVRRRLDEAILPFLEQDPIDLEVIEDILDATVAEFENCLERCCGHGDPRDVQETR